MKRITFLLVTVATLTGVLAFTGSPGQAQQAGAPDLRNRNSVRIPRLEIDFRRT